EYMSISKNEIKTNNEDLEISADALKLSVSRGGSWEFSTKDFQNHGFIKSGRVGLKFLNTLNREIQARNDSDTAYANLTGASGTFTEDSEYKKKLRVRGELRVEDAIL